MGRGLRSGGRRPRLGRVPGRASLLLVVSAIILSGSPALAGQLRQSIRDRTLSCGMGVAFYVNGTGTDILVAGYGSDAGTGIAEAALVLDTRTMPIDQDDRFDVAVRGPASTARLRFGRIGRTGVGNRGGAVHLFVDDDTLGDECVVERGRASFDEVRFNAIREGLCGNDPIEACIAALEKGCGSTPDAACVQRVRPALERINARAGRNPR